MIIRVNGMLTSAVHPSFLFLQNAEVLSAHEVGAQPDRFAIGSGGLGATPQQADRAFRYRKALLANISFIKYP